jgi:arginine deiminase
LKELENDTIIENILKRIEKLNFSKYFSLKYTKGIYSHFVKKLKAKDISIEQVENDIKSLNDKSNLKKSHTKKPYNMITYSDRPVSFEKMLRNNRK